MKDFVTLSETEQKTGGGKDKEGHFLRKRCFQITFLRKSQEKARHYSTVGYFDPLLARSRDQNETKCLQNQLIFTESHFLNGPKRCPFNPLCKVAAMKGLNTRVSILW